MFVVREKDKIRSILICQRINQYIQCHHFKMEGVPALRDIIEYTTGTDERIRNQSGLLPRRYLYVGTNEERNAIKHANIAETFADTRVHYQPDQEPIDSNENAGVPWLYVRHGSNENLGSVQENREDEKSNQTSDKNNIPKILSLGCKPDRENDGNDSGHRERITTREVSTEGFSTIIANEYSELGSSIQTIQGSNTGLELVVYNEYKAE
ncbi:hypothetical protein G6F56_010084 [Rhizopus delemar]|nr:hypothetical protein G6F56_010084 [Rhizopus delemar]